MSEKNPMEMGLNDAEVPEVKSLEEYEVNKLDERGLARVVVDLNLNRQSPSTDLRRLMGSDNYEKHIEMAVNYIKSIGLEEARKRFIDDGRLYIEE